MKAQFLKKEGCVIYFSADVPKEDMSGFEATVINDIMKKSSIPGFRPGKAPRERVIRHYKDIIKKNILEKHLGMICTEAFQQLDIQPLLEPVLEEIHYELTQPLQLKGQVEIFPDFTLSEYKDLKLVQKISSVSETEVDQTIQQFAETSAQFELVEDRPLQKEDFAILDYEIFYENKSIEKKQGTWVKIKEDSFIKDFCISLVGMKIGDKKDMEIVLPENYIEKQVAGKKVMIHVQLNGIRIKILPEINDDYVKKLDQGYTDLSDYKKKIHDYLLSLKKKDSERNIRDQIRQHLLKTNPMELPPTILEIQTEDNFRDTMANLRVKQISEDVLARKKEEIFKDAREHAAQQLKLEFIFQKIIEKEKLDVADKDYEEALKKEAEALSLSKEALKGMLESQKRMGVFRHRVRMENVMNWILGHAQITTVSGEKE
ncbi:MAG: trigger factor [Candidatus Aureabacteria bacterium]|nr:trigger factor [Candidatus Auribacterota bacterium]